MGKTLLFIHGCDQESPPGVADDDARLREYIDSINRDWLAGLSRGLVLARSQPVSDDEVVFPFYADHFRQRVREYEANGGRPPELEIRTTAELGWSDSLRSPVRRTAPQFLSRLLTDVAYYFELDGMRRAVLNIVEDALRERNPGGGPVVVVGHGLGSVVAYDLLTRLSDDIDVRLLVTAGSPLGHPIVQKNLLGGENNRRPRVPRRLVARRAAWVNAYDVQDFASLVHPIAGGFDGSPADQIVDQRTFNPTDPHSIAGYLADADVSGPIGHAMHEG